MAMHRNEDSMLRESIYETLHLARYGITYRKLDQSWAPYNTGGCLGYPSAMLLFSVIDAIGSRFKNKLAIPIDGQSVTITKTDEHFRIINSKYFEQNLSGKDIKTIYIGYRSRLSHNLVLNNNLIMDIGSGNQQPFEWDMDPFGQIAVLWVRLFPLLELCEKAVKKYFTDVGHQHEVKYETRAS
jgi:hypothetical protein